MAMYKHMLAIMDEGRLSSIHSNLVLRAHVTDSALLIPAELLLLHLVVTEQSSSIRYGSLRDARAHRDKLQSDGPLDRSFKMLSTQLF